MPELPEVERGRRLAEKTAVGRRIARCEVADDPIVFEGVAPGEFRGALVDRRVIAAHRKGKHIWLELDERPWPLFHFGMTGAFRTPCETPLELATGPRRGPDEWPPRFTKIRIQLEDGGELVMTNARRLGRIRLRNDPSGEPPISRLGFDPLTDLPSSRTLGEILKERKVPLKALLLDQSFSAGVGNWMADEILYQARLDPIRPAHSVTPEEVRRLRSRMRAVVHRAVEVDAEKDRFPRTWLFHRRWGRKAGSRTARGEKIEFIRIGGRTTAWVPTVQK